MPAGRVACLPRVWFPLLNIPVKWGQVEEHGEKKDNDVRRALLWGWGPESPPPPQGGEEKGLGL